MTTECWDEPRPMREIRPGAFVPEQPVVVFHAPYPLQPGATSASGIRPVKMRQAFSQAGARVIDISGDAATRARRIRGLRALQRDGLEVDAVYSESSTMPTLMTQPHHLPTHPRLDAAFLRSLDRRGTPVGLFYRDIYWRFEEYRERVGALTSQVTTSLYWHDLRWYRRVLSRLYIPSLRMAEHIPHLPRALMGELPPGCDIIEHPARDQRARDLLHAAGAGATSPQNNPNGPAGASTSHSATSADAPSIRLFYVGGVGSHYAMDAAIAGVSRSQAGQLTICTREQEWEQVSERYRPLMGEGRVGVVHESGSQVSSRLGSSDIGMLLMEPQTYRDFAVPFKFYEYLGNGVPIIATQGTLIGQIVADNQLGWAIPYEAQALAALIDDLAAHPQHLLEASQRVQAYARAHTWEARARQVVDDLIVPTRTLGTHTQG